MIRKFSELKIAIDPMAMKIATFLMENKSATPRDLISRFGLVRELAFKIFDTTTHAFGPGGKGLEWFANKIEYFFHHPKTWQKYLTEYDKSPKNNKLLGF